MFSFLIDGEVSSKKNENKFNRVTGRVFKSDRFRNWHNSAMIQLNTQEKPLQPIAEPVNVSVAFFHGDNRRRDGDNGLSAIMDLLVDARILADDCWRIVKTISVSNYFDKGNARCTIQIHNV